VLLASLAASSVQVLEDPWAVGAVGVVALGSTLVSIRLRFRGERLFGSRVTTFYTLLLICISTGGAVVVAGVRPFGLAFLGVAAPVPFRRQEDRDSDRTTSSLTTVLGFIAGKLGQELGELKRSVCGPTVVALRSGRIDPESFAEALKESVFYWPGSEGEKTARYAEVLAALDSCGTDPLLGPTALVSLAYNWNFRDLLTPLKDGNGAQAARQDPPAT
jgi:hypothetical protein